MRYKVPTDMNIKEKTIGGVLTLNQFGWLLIGLILGGILFASTFKIFGSTIAIILFILCLPLGVPFAFYKKNGLSLFRYLILKRLFNKKNKKLIYKRKVERGDVI